MVKGSSPAIAAPGERSFWHFKFRQQWLESGQTITLSSQGLVFESSHYCWHQEREKAIKFYHLKSD